MPKLTPEACRAARAILKWSVRKCADEAGIAFSTLHLFEKNGNATAQTEAKIVAAFERNSVEVTNGEGTGVRLRKSE